MTHDQLSIHVQRWCYSKRKIAKFNHYFRRGDRVGSISWIVSDGSILSITQTIVFLSRVRERDSVYEVDESNPFYKKGDVRKPSESNGLRHTRRR